MQSNRKIKQWYIKTEHGILEQDPVDMDQALYLADFLVRNGFKQVKIIKGQRTLFDFNKKKSLTNISQHAIDIENLKHRS